jgi:hypothetical protein
VLPSSSPSYVPAPYESSTAHGGEVIFEYTPTSSGYVTETIEIEPTSSGYVTYVSVPTADGYSSYTESSSSYTAKDGSTYTVVYETLSNGATETV